MNRSPDLPPILNASAICGCLIGLSGCGNKATGPNTYPVEGTVLFDGKPVEMGDIVFFPEDPAVSPEASKITNGKFSFKAKEGQNRVEIQAARQTSDKRNVDESGNPIPLFDSYIPSAYNKESKLKAHVKPDRGGNVFDFTLTKDGK